MARPVDPKARARVIDAATRLFAERGYAGTTTRALAAEAGVNVATVHYHAGSKFELFTAVLEALYQEEAAILGERLAPLEEGPIDDTAKVIDVLVGAASAIIDLMASRPERPRLYLRRWLDPSDELRPFEVKISLDAHRRLRELLERAKAGGAVDRGFPVETFLRSFTWLIYGYFATGPIDWNDWFSDPLKPAHLEDLRRLVTLYVRQSLAASWS
ncbi:MAG: TetR/AcrR family transcriptional regulator [Deltaproteobacteria bacterium]|nr:TetR/AcrR family transcriptional regulator [Deltaproteobacteria bacterium]